MQADSTNAVIRTERSNLDFRVLESEVSAFKSHAIDAIETAEEACQEVQAEVQAEVQELENRTKERLKAIVSFLTEDLSISKLAVIVLGTAIASFGIHNIHQQVALTEGGILGLILLLNHWFGLAPAVLTTLLDLICYAFTTKHLGAHFIKNSFLATISLSLWYSVWEFFPPMLPNLSSRPLLAAVLGGMFVGIGVGLVIRQGGSCGGDDALALLISKLTHCRISRAYLFTDLTVLVLSLSYIPLRRIAFSLVTVTISSLLIDAVKSFSFKKEMRKEKNAEQADDASAAISLQ